MRLAAIAGAMIVAALAFVVSGGASAPHAAVYYVDASGSDTTGTGSRSKPWRTLAKACASTPGGTGNTIRVNAGSYVESATCRLRCATNLRGAGPGRTTIRGSADPLIVVRNCTHRANEQTIAGLRLDGGGRTAGVFGLRAVRTRGMTITNMLVEGFKGPPDAGGGAIDVSHAWDLDLGHSTLRNSGNENERACSGTLGLGNLHDSKVHDLAISDDEAYGVKTSTRGVASSSAMSNVEFYNLNVQVGHETCARWNSLAFELYRVDAVNVVIRDSRFNRVVSLISEEPRLRRGFRFRVHHNAFTIPRSNYAIELHTHSSVVDHNFFDGGTYPVAAFSRASKVGNVVHHNVFDNQSGPTAAMHLTGGVTNALFYNNTLVLRQSGWRDGVFSFGEAVGYSGATSEIKNNIFMSTQAIGDKLGLGLGSSTIDRNGFYNISARGTNALVANPQLPLTGGFPNAYVPTGGPAAALGAFANGSWSVGPS